MLVASTSTLAINLTSHFFKSPLPLLDNPAFNFCLSLFIVVLVWSYLTVTRLYQVYDFPVVRFSEWVIFTTLNALYPLTGFLALLALTYFLDGLNLAVWIKLIISFIVLVVIYLGHQPTTYWIHQKVSRFISRHTK